MVTDEPGWYPDAAGRYELRYWDGGAWTDNVSNKGVASTDLVGGKPLPSPSQAAANAAAKPASTGGQSKTPFFVIFGVAAVVVIGALAVYLLKGDDTKKNGLGTFTETAADVNHPSIHQVNVGANKGIFITMDPKDNDALVAYVVLTKKAIVNKLINRVNGADSVFTESFDNVFTDLRAEDIGATGDVGYFGGAATNPGDTLRSVVPIIEAGDYEVIPLVVDGNGKRIVKQYKITLEVRPLDLGTSSEFTDLESTFSDASVVTDFTDGTG
jgi:hypothetical protein